MLLPGYYLRVVRITDGGIIPEEILIDEFYSDKAMAESRRALVERYYHATDRDLAILHISQKRKTALVEQAAEMLGVSRRTIYNWMRKGMVEYVLTPNGSRRILTDTLPREKDSCKWLSRRDFEYLKTG